MNTFFSCISKLPAHAGTITPSLNTAAFVIVLASTVSACGGSGGGDAGDIARDGFDDQVLVRPIQQDGQVLDDVLDAPVMDDPVIDDLVQNDESCIANIDIADFFLTETDRQWSCEVSSVVGTRFDELFFDRNGTANFASTGTWYWNRNLPADEITLASPAEPSTLITDIGSSNSVLVFRSINEEEFEEIYDCVLVERALITSL